MSGRVPGGFDTVDVSEDPGFDDPTAQFLGSANLRLGRHDFWVTGFSYDESEDVKVEDDLDFGDVRVGVNRRMMHNSLYMKVTCPV